MKEPYDKEARLAELQSILLSKGLIDKDEDVVPEMLGDLAQFAYLTSCITKGDVKRLLGIDGAEVKKIIRSWKLWDEGNRSCGLTRNPFTEEWALGKDKTEKD